MEGQWKGPVDLSGVGELEQFYDMKIAALSTSTLDEIMRQEMGPDRMSVGAGVNFGPLRFCIRQLSEEGRIELVGMSVRPESAMDEGVSDPTQT